MSRAGLVLSMLLVACGRERFDDASNVDGIAHDEDLDGVNDPGDNCPAAFNELQDDRDGDGVGDVCDPHPDTDGDKLIASGFFTDQFGDWVPNAADAWVFANGSIEPANPDPDAVAVALSLTAALTLPTVQLVITPIDYGVVMAEHLVEVTISYPDETVSCTTSSGDGNPFSKITVVVNATTNTSIGLGQPIAAGMPAVVSLTRDVAQATCRVASGNLVNTNGTLGTGTAAITIDVRKARVGITNALVYDVP